MVANRPCEPNSTLEVWDRWLPTVYLPSCWDLKLEQMYEAMDVLYEHGVEVEKHVFFETATVFNLKVDLIFYETTTPSCSIDEEDKGLGSGPGHPTTKATAQWAIDLLASTRFKR
jgi:hypothetical protein